VWPPKRRFDPGREAKEETQDFDLKSLQTKLPIVDACIVTHFKHTNDTERLIKITLYNIINVIKGQDRDKNI